MIDKEYNPNHCDDCKDEKCSHCTDAFEQEPIKTGGGFMGNFCRSVVLIRRYAQQKIINQLVQQC